MSLSQRLESRNVVLRPTLTKVAALFLTLSLGGCALLSTKEAPTPEVAVTEAPRPAPKPAPNEIWLSISDQEALERLRTTLENNPLKLKPAPDHDETSSNRVDALGQVKSGAYLDCGTARITTMNNKSVEVPAAKSFQQFKQRVNGVDYSVWRSMHLGVRARLEVKPRPDAAGASIRYEPTYSVTRERLVTGPGKQPMVFRDAIQFGSADSASFTNASAPCRSNGRLERELRDMIAGLEQTIPQPEKPKTKNKTNRTSTKKFTKPVSPLARRKDVLAVAGSAP